MDRPSWQHARAHGYHLSSLSSCDRTWPGPAVFPPHPTPALLGIGPDDRHLLSAAASRSLSVMGEDPKIHGPNFPRLASGPTCCLTSSGLGTWTRVVSEHRTWTLEPGCLGSNPSPAAPQLCELLHSLSLSLLICDMGGPLTLEICHKLMHAKGLTNYKVLIQAHVVITDILEIL